MLTMAETIKTPSWRNILWREWYHCDDPDYAERLYKAAYHGPLSWLKRLSLRGQSRPLAYEVEAALYHGCQVSRGAAFVWAQRLEQLEKKKRKRTPLTTLIKNLEDHHWLERFMARHVLLYRGGQAVRSLYALIHAGPPTLSETARWLLLSIEADSTQRLGAEAARLLCPDCLVHCYRHKTEGDPAISFYGCRTCRRSYEFEAQWQEVVAVLDDQMMVDRMVQGSSLRINWFRFQDPFDFDRVEIIRADDETIERFAVEIGNDTDPVRAPTYQTMPCTVTCPLSGNTLRILERIFGEVTETG